MRSAPMALANLRIVFCRVGVGMSGEACAERLQQSFLAGPYAEQGCSRIGACRGKRLLLNCREYPAPNSRSVHAVNPMLNIHADAAIPCKSEQRHPFSVGHTEASLSASGPRRTGLPNCLTPKRRDSGWQQR